MGAAEDFAAGRQDAHLAKKLIFRHREKRLDARILQRRKTESALLKHPAEAPGERGAGGTIGVKEDPAASGTSSLTISNY